MEIKIDQEGEEYVMRLQLSKEEYEEFMNSNNSAGDANPPSGPSPELGLFGKKWCATCSANRQETVTVTAWNSVLATIAAAPTCALKTGNPSNSVREGSC